MRHLLKPASLFAFLLYTATALSQSAKHRRDAENELLTRNMVEARRFQFRAQMAIPMGGASRQLTPEYEVRVTPDSVISYLPYFGRAYTAPLDPLDIGIKFTSTHFDYTRTTGKRGSWEILIKPRDVTDTRQLQFTISGNGTATLQVISNSRDPVSFYGYLATGNERKKH